MHCGQQVGWFGGGEDDGENGEWVGHPATRRRPATTARPTKTTRTSRLEVRPSGKRASASSHLTAEVVRVDAAGGGGPGRAAGWCTSGRHCRAPLTPLTALATVPSPPPHCDAVPAAPADAALHLSLALSRTVRSASVGGKWGGKVGADGIMRLGRFCQHAQPPTPTLQDSGGGGLCERPAGPPHAGRRLGGGRGPRARRWRARLVTCRRHAGRVICGGRPGGITAGKGWDGGCRCGVNISCNFPNPEVSLSLRGISWASGGLISRPPSRRIRVAPALAALQTLQARTTGTIGLVVVQGGVDRADGAGPATPSAAAARPGGSQARAPLAHRHLAHAQGGAAR